MIRIQRDTVDRSPERERGAGLVELALAIPVFVTIMLGTITSGMAINDDLQLTHAAREGARYGATIPVVEVFASGTWATNVRAVAIERFGDGLTAADVCVALVTGSPPSPISAAHTTKGDGTACYNDAASGVSDDRVQVTVTKDTFIDTVFYRHDVTLLSEATAQHESNG